MERGWRASGAELVNVPSLLRDRSFEKEFAPLLERARSRDEAQIATLLILREILASRFDMEELRALCLELGIDPGQFSDDAPTMAKYRLPLIRSECSARFYPQKRRVYLERVYASLY